MLWSNINLEDILNFLQSNHFEEKKSENKSFQVSFETKKENFHKILLYGKIQFQKEKIEENTLEKMKNEIIMEFQKEKKHKEKAEKICQRFLKERIFPLEIIKNQKKWTEFFSDFYFGKFGSGEKCQETLEKIKNNQNEENWSTKIDMEEVLRIIPSIIESETIPSPNCILKPDHISYSLSDISFIPFNQNGFPHFQSPLSQNNLFDCFPFDLGYLSITKRGSNEKKKIKLTSSKITVTSQCQKQRALCGDQRGFLHKVDLETGEKLWTHYHRKEQVPVQNISLGPDYSKKAIVIWEDGQLALVRSDFGEKLMDLDGAGDIFTKGELLGVSWNKRGSHFMVIRRNLAELCSALGKLDSVEIKYPKEMEEIDSFYDLWAEKGLILLQNRKRQTSFLLQLEPRNPSDPLTF